MGGWSTDCSRFRVVLLVVAFAATTSGGGRRIRRLAARVRRVAGMMMVVRRTNLVRCGNVRLVVVHSLIVHHRRRDVVAAGRHDRGARMNDVRDGGRVRMMLVVVGVMMTGVWHGWEGTTTVRKV